MCKIASGKRVNKQGPQLRALWWLRVVGREWVEERFKREGIYITQLISNEAEIPIGQTVLPSLIWGLSRDLFLTSPFPAGKSDTCSPSPSQACEAYPDCMGLVSPKLSSGFCFSCFLFHFIVSLGCLPSQNSTGAFQVNSTSDQNPHSARGVPARRCFPTFLWLLGLGRGGRVGQACGGAQKEREVGSGEEEARLSWKPANWPPTVCPSARGQPCPWPWGMLWGPEERTGHVLVAYIILIRERNKAVWTQILLWLLEAAWCNGEMLALVENKAVLNPDSSDNQPCGSCKSA